MDDPKRPYKAIVAAIVAALTVPAAQYADRLPWWVLMIIATLVAGLSTFTVRNPKTGE